MGKKLRKLLVEVDKMVGRLDTAGGEDKEDSVNEEIVDTAGEVNNEEQVGDELLVSSLDFPFLLLALENNGEVKTILFICYYVLKLLPVPTVLKYT